MLVCKECGEENPDRARFCLGCAAPLEAPASREVRKSVTLVFTDLVGSTALAERLDPESVRRIIARYFARMSSILEAHGGTVEKFVGDAILAVFGIPQLHEDDALRAVRAASEMRDAMVELNRELTAESGIELLVRTGINTGEVLAGDPGSGHAFVSGDPVNVAARLEQHAAPGEILIGPATLRLVRNAAITEAVAPIEAKGKAEPLMAHRLLDVRAGVPGFVGRPNADLVGREHERELLRQGYERAVKERACHLFTILGPAGVGKSRLVTDFLEGLPPGIEVARGQCLPYGEGITYWPLAEAIRDMADIPDTADAAQAAALLGRRLSGQEAETVTGILLQLLALAPVVNSVDELSWAVRRLFEQVASSAPLVVVIEDIHWAEPALLDTIEYVADWARSSPILLVCVARPDLLDERPNWGGGKPNATSFLLEPLDEASSGRLVRQVLGDADLPSSIEKKIADTAEGNPLYVEQMLEMMIDDGCLVREGETWRATLDADALSVPPTISALLAARLDRLGLEERQVIERASVIGRVFYSGAVREMTPGPSRDGLRHNLQALVRKELVRPDEDAFVGEDSFRFGHILIRDAAYAGLPKEQRAEYHQAFADWVERRSGERLVEFQDIVAHHLYESYRYRVDLGLMTDETRSLARRSAELSRASADRAINRGDNSAAAKLLERSAELLPEGSAERWAVLLDLAQVALVSGDFDRSSHLLDTLLEGDAPATTKDGARIAKASLALFGAPDAETMEHAKRVARQVIAAGGGHGDHRTLAGAWVILQISDMISGLMRDAVSKGLEALEHARAAGNRYLEGEICSWLFASVSHGPARVEEAISLIDEILKGSGSQVTVASGGTAASAYLIGLRGDVDRAREQLRPAREMLRQLGQGVVWGMLVTFEAEVDVLAGDHERAVRVLEEACEELERYGEKSVYSTSVVVLADYLCDLGRYEEAEVCALKSKAIRATEDASTESLWRSVLARVEASRGKFDDAHPLLDEALERIERSDLLGVQAQVHKARAEVLGAEGRFGDAQDALRAALELHRRKGADAHVRSIKRRLSELAQA